MTEKDKKLGKDKTPDDKTPDDGWKPARKQMYIVLNELDKKTKDH